MNSNVLSFEQTDRFKGMLILFIILGHISQVFEDYASLHSTLYSFHVISFLLLPFLFNKDLLNSKNLKKNLKRIYVPYTIFFILALLAYSILEHQFNLLSILRAWAIGSSHFLQIDIGLRVLWFFPALMFSIILLMVFNTLSKNNKIIYLLIMFLLHILIPFIPESYLFYFPLSSYVSMYLFIIGISVQYIYKNFNYTQYPTWIYSLLFISTLYLGFELDYFVTDSRFSLASAMFPNIIDNTFDFILQDIIMVLSFFTLMLWSKQIKFFETFGKYSLALFTIHPFVIQALNMLHDWAGLADGLIKFLLVVIITYAIVRIVYFFKINKILYPH